MLLPCGSQFHFKNVENDTIPARDHAGTTNKAGFRTYRYPRYRIDASANQSPENELRISPPFLFGVSVFVYQADIHAMSLSGLLSSLIRLFPLVLFFTFGHFCYIICPLSLFQGRQTLFGSRFSHLVGLTAQRSSTLSRPSLSDISHIDWTSCTFGDRFQFKKKSTEPDILSLGYFALGFHLGHCPTS